jgi:predicted PurR-regulated permease PerM
LAIFSPALPSSKTVQLGVAVIACASLTALLYYGRDFFVTLIISAVFAFILDPMVQLVMKLRLPRAASTLIVIGITATLAYVLCLVAWTQLLSISDDLPTYSSRVSELVEKANTGLDELEKKTIAMVVPQNLREQEEQIEQKPLEAMKARRRRAGLAPLPVLPPVIQEVRIHTDPKPLLGTLFVYASRYFHTVVMASFVPFLVYFMLSWRDHISETFLGLFKGEHRYVVGRSWLAIGEATRAYVLGNFFLWVFVGSISAIAFFFLEVPYWPLIGPLSAFLSLVPYVGLPLSVVPPVMAALAIPNKFKIVMTVLIFTASLHILAMNFLYPKVIGKRVRLNPLAVTVALMFWGLMWGGVGLVLAVPLMAAMKAVFDNVESLQSFGRMLGD